MNVRFIGCLHLGHTNMAKWRGFQDDFYHDEHLIDSWNGTVNKRDLTFILGDITMEKANSYPLLDRLNGRKIVVLGNHDRWQDVGILLKHVDSVAGAIDYKGFMLTHVPIHPNEVVNYRGNIHAHIHHNKLQEVCVNPYKNPEVSMLSQNMYYHVDAHVINYKPKTISELVLDA